MLVAASYAPLGAGVDCRTNIRTETFMNRKDFLKVFGLGLTGMGVFSKKALGSASPTQTRFWRQEEIELFGRKAMLFHWPKDRHIYLYRDFDMSVSVRPPKWCLMEEGDFILVPTFDVRRYPITKEMLDKETGHLYAFKIEDHPNLMALVVSEKTLRPVPGDAQGSSDNGQLYNVVPGTDVFNNLDCFVPRESLCKNKELKVTEEMRKSFVTIEKHDLKILNWFISDPSKTERMEKFLAALAKT